MIELNDGTSLIEVSTTLDKLDKDIIVIDNTDKDIDNLTRFTEPIAQPLGTVKAVPYKEKGTMKYYKIKEVTEIYNLQVVLFRIITDYKERAFMFEYWTDSTYKFYIWTGFNYNEIDIYNCNKLDKVTAYLLEGLEYYLSGLNYSDEGKTLKFKIKDVMSSVIIDDVDFKEV